MDKIIPRWKFVLCCCMHIIVIHSLPGVEGLTIIASFWAYSKSRAWERVAVNSIARDQEHLISYPRGVWFQWVQGVQVIRSDKNNAYKNIKCLIKFKKNVPSQYLWNTLVWINLYVSHWLLSWLLQTAMLLVLIIDGIRCPMTWIVAPSGTHLWLHCVSVQWIVQIGSNIMEKSWVSEGATVDALG